MVRSWMLVAAAGLGLLGVSPATAETTILADDYSANEQRSVAGNFALGPGTYRLSLSFSEPVGDAFGWVENNRIFNEYCDFGSGEFLCGGNQALIIPLFEMVNPQLYQLTLAVDAPSTETWPVENVIVRRTTSDSCCSYGFNFTSIDAGSFNFNYAAIPEPGTWMMMILGFAGIGFAARRRLSSVKAAPPILTS